MRFVPNKIVSISTDSRDKCLKGLIPNKNENESPQNKLYEDFYVLLIKC